MGEPIRQSPGCIECKFYREYECRSKESTLVFFDSKLGVDQIYYKSPQTIRGGRRYCPSFEQKPGFWKSIKIAIMGE
jgi:hypothetical protein